MAAASAEVDAAPADARPLRIAVPKGSLNAEAIACLEEAGLDVTGLANPGRSLVISNPGVDYIIVRPSDAPVFVALAPPTAASAARTRFWKWALPWRSWSICASAAAASSWRSRPARARPSRSATASSAAYASPRSTLPSPVPTSRAPAPRWRSSTCTATSSWRPSPAWPSASSTSPPREPPCARTTWRSWKRWLASTARFFANGCALRTDERIVALARVLAENAPKHTYAPIAGASNPVQPTLS